MSMTRRALLQSLAVAPLAFGRRSASEGSDALVLRVTRNLTGLYGTKAYWPKGTVLGPQGLASDGKHFYMGFVRGLTTKDGPDVVCKFPMSGDDVMPDGEFELPPFCRHTNHLEIRGGDLVAMTWNNNSDQENAAYGYDGIHPDSVWRIKLVQPASFSVASLILGDWGRDHDWHIQTAHWDTTNFTVCLANEKERRFRLATYNAEGVLRDVTEAVDLPGTIQGAICQKTMFTCLSENGISAYSVVGAKLLLLQTVPLFPAKRKKFIEPEGLALVDDVIYYLLTTNDEDPDRPKSEECQVYKFRLGLSDLAR